MIRLRRRLLLIAIILSTLPLWILGIIALLNAPR